MFRTAYEAKGLLPAQHDPFPSASERCADIIRNNEYVFSAALQEQRKWPRFPLMAPWPVLTLRMFARLAALPVPEDKKAAREVLTFLEEEKCDLPAALVTYRLALDGLPALLSRTEKEFNEHLVSIRLQATRENDSACAMMAVTVKTTAERIPDRKQRRQWALGLRKLALGREKYFDHKYRVGTDAIKALLPAV